MTQNEREKRAELVRYFALPDAIKIYYRKAEDLWGTMGYKFEYDGNLYGDYIELPYEDNLQEAEKEVLLLALNHLAKLMCAEYEEADDDDTE